MEPASYYIPKEEWTKSRDNKLVKIKIPNYARRTGGRSEWCRASEVSILEINDGDRTCEEFSDLDGKKGTYHKGDTVKADAFDESIYHDGEGIHFRLSRGEAEKVMYESDEDDAKSSDDE